MSRTTEQIYNSLKRKSSSTEPTSMNMEDIIKRSYELGLEFARRTQKKPIAKLNEGGVIADKDNDIIAMEAIHDLKHSYPEKYNNLREKAAQSPKFMRWLEESFKHVTENEGETRTFAEWMPTSGFDEKIMGFLYSSETGYDKDNLPYGSFREPLEKFQEEWEGGLKEEAVSNIVVATEEEASNYPFKEGTTHDYQYENGQGKIYKKPKPKPELELKELDLEKTQAPKLQDGGSIEEDYSNYGSSTNPYPETEENYDIKNLTRYFLGQGVALGFGDELEAFVSSKVGEDTYKNNLSIIKEEMKNYKEENPVTATIAEGAGALVTGTGIAASAVRLGVKGIAKTAATTGAIEGGLYGFGAPETFGTEDRLKGSAFGAATFATAGTVLGVAGDQAFKFGKNLYKTIPTITRRNFVNNLDQGTEKGSIKLFHGDSGTVPDDLPDDALGRQMADIQIKNSDTGLTHDGVQYTPLKEFRKDTRLSLAVDKDNSTNYFSGTVDAEGTKGFLYEVSVPEDVIKNLFDPFNPRHRKLLTKELTKLYDNKQLDYVAPALETKGWKGITKKQKQNYLEYRYLDPIQMQQKIYSPVPDYSTTIVPPKSSKDTYWYAENNWGILENRRTVMALKNLKFKGTWQKELEQDQIQIFDGSSVDIIPGKTIQFKNEEEFLQLNSLDSFLDNAGTSKQGGVEIQTAEQFNKMLKDSKDAGENVIFDGKKVNFGDKK